jgi:hypothetical protein
LLDGDRADLPEKSRERPRTSDGEAADTSWERRRRRRAAANGSSAGTAASGGDRWRRLDASGVDGRLDGKGGERRGPAAAEAGQEQRLGSGRSNPNPSRHAYGKGRHGENAVHGESGASAVPIQLGSWQI